jgi:hypothetical protein
MTDKFIIEGRVWFVKQQSNRESNVETQTTAALDLTITA